MLIVNQTRERIFNLDNILSIYIRKKRTYEILCETENTECVLARYNTEEDAKKSYQDFLVSYRITETFKYLQPISTQAEILEKLKEEDIDIYVYHFD